MRPTVYIRKMRYSDTDAQGIVFNANYLRYLDDTMTDLFEALGFGGELFKNRGYEWVVARTEIDYKSLAKLGDTLRTEVHVAEWGTSSFTVHGRIVNEANDSLVAESRQVQVVVDATTFLPAPIPDFFKAAVVELQEEAPRERSK